MVIIDGVEVTEEELKGRLQEANKNPNIIIKEVETGVYKTLERLQG